MSVAMNEQETVIRFGRDSEECEIYTSDTTVMTKLDKLASKNNDKAPLWKLKEEHRTKATHELVGKTYLVCIGNVKVKIRFANNGVSFEDAFEELLLSV